MSDGSHADRDDSLAPTAQAPAVGVGAKRTAGEVGLHTLEDSVSSTASTLPDQVGGGAEATASLVTHSQDVDMDEQVTAFCGVAGADANAAKAYLAMAGGALELALSLFFDSANTELGTNSATDVQAGPGSATCVSCGGIVSEGGWCWCEEYSIRCPYADCQRIYSVKRWDLRCGKVRCGGNTYEGSFCQFPKHARRAGVESWLAESEWNGHAWEGWPGETKGCGRPFRFPKECLVYSDLNDGIFLTWDDEDAPMGARTIDAEGDYSRVV